MWLSTRGESPTLPHLAAPDGRQGDRAHGARRVAAHREAVPPPCPRLPNEAGHLGTSRARLRAAPRSRRSRARLLPGESIAVGVRAKAWSRDVIYRSQHTQPLARPNFAVPRRQSAYVPGGRLRSSSTIGSSLRAQVTRRSRVDADGRQVAPPPRRSRSRAELGGGRRRSLLGSVQARPRSGRLAAVGDGLGEAAARFPA